LREWYGFAIGAAFSGVVGVGFYPIMEIVFGVVLCPHGHIGITNVYYQNLELPLMVVNVEIALPTEMGIDVRVMKRRKHLFVPPSVGSVVPEDMKLEK
jgi:hypothetical protein